LSLSSYLSILHQIRWSFVKITFLYCIIIQSHLSFIILNCTLQVNKRWKKAFRPRIQRNCPIVQFRMYKIANVKISVKTSPLFLEKIAFKFLPEILDNIKKINIELILFCMARIWTSLSRMTLSFHSSFSPNIFNFKAK
jgi:hypothetical protein